MKLVHPDYEYQIELEELIINSIIVESPSENAKLLGELISQTRGEEGRFVLSENGKEIKISSKVCCIVDPFSVDINGRKPLDKLISICNEEIMQTELYIEKERLIQDTLSFCSKVFERIDYPVDYDTSIEIKDVLKLVGVRLCLCKDSLLAYIVDYIKIMNQLMGYDIFVLPNIKAYLSSEDLSLLKKDIDYRKIHLIFWESREPFVVEKYEKVYIIDKDRCEIY